MTTDNTETTLVALKTDVNNLHVNVGLHLKSAKEDAATAGEKLIEAKSVLGHGEFQPWVEANCEFGYRMAAKYMQVAKAKSESRCTFDEATSIAEVLEIGKAKQDSGAPETVRATEAKLSPLEVARLRIDCQKRMKKMDGPELTKFLCEMQDKHDFFDMFHPANEVMPKQNPETYLGLLEDIMKRGQLIPILRYKGQVLDGRHRLRACRDLGIKPIFEDIPYDTPEQQATGLCAFVNGIVPQVQGHEKTDINYLARGTAMGHPDKDATLLDCANFTLEQIEKAMGGVDGYAGEANAKKAGMKVEGYRNPSKRRLPL